MQQSGGRSTHRRNRDPRRRLGKLSNPFRRFQARKARASCLGVLGRTNPPICETLACCTGNGDFCTTLIVYAKADAVGVAESELIQIALQVLLAAMLIHTNHAALEDAEKAFDAVGGHMTALRRP